MRVSELTVDELRTLIFETVEEALQAALDPDAALEVREEFQALLSQRVAAGAARVSPEEARRRLGL